MHLHRADVRLRQAVRHGRAAILIAIGLAGCAIAPAPAATSSDVPDPLVVGLIPNVSPERQRARYEPLGDYLEDALGVSVELFVASNYAGVVTAMASNQVDLAYLGAVTYVQAERQVEVVPLVTEIDRATRTSTYLSSIVVRADSGLESLADVLATGGAFAMGDVASTSGSLYPRLMLLDAGADCRPSDLTVCPPLEIAFTGGHDAAALAVLSGQAVAGGLERRILDRLVREGTVPADALTVLEERAVQGYPWVARAAIGPVAHEAITAAFLAMEDPALLDLLGGLGYTRVDRDDYAEVRAESRRVGLLDGAAGGDR